MSALAPPPPDEQLEPPADGASGCVDLLAALWLPGRAPAPGEAALARRAVATVLDSGAAADPAAAFARAARLGAVTEVVDLAWLRLDAWRALAEEAGATALAGVERLEIRFRGADAAGPLLLAGWIAVRAGWALTRVKGSGETWHGGAVRADGGRVELVLGREGLVAGSDGLAELVLHRHGETLRIGRPAGIDDRGAALSAALGSAAAGDGAPLYAAALAAIAQGLAAA